MDKAIYANKGLTVVLEGDQRQREITLTLKYKGTTQKATLDSVKPHVIREWMNERLDHFFDFHFHTTGHLNPLEFTNYHKSLNALKEQLRPKIFDDEEVKLIIELSESLADFLEEEDSHDGGVVYLKDDYKGDIENRLNVDVNSEYYTDKESGTHA